VRYPADTHFFASLKPYLDWFLRQGRCENGLLSRGQRSDLSAHPEYASYAHLFSDNCDFEAYDLVLTPGTLRPEAFTPRMRAVQVFHGGISDKPFTYEQDFSRYALCLITGQRQLERILHFDYNRSMRWVMVGHPKFDHIPEVPRLFDNDKLTLIYAPTWQRYDISSLEIFLSRPDVIRDLARRYNLIVKPHPNVFHPHLPTYTEDLVRRLEALEDLPGIKLVRAGNVMPLFAQSHLYLGDISSSGYEWLYFDRPMIFLNPKPGVLHAQDDPYAFTYLWQCGNVCDDMQALPALVADALQGDRHHEVREQLLHYSVYKPRDAQATRRGAQAIEELLAGVAA